MIWAVVNRNGMSNQSATSLSQDPNWFGSKQCVAVKIHRELRMVPPQRSLKPIRIETIHGQASSWAFSPPMIRETTVVDLDGEHPRGASASYWNWPYPRTTTIKQMRKATAVFIDNHRMTENNGAIFADRVRAERSDSSNRIWVGWGWVWVGWVCGCGCGCVRVWGGCGCEVGGGGVGDSGCLVGGGAVSVRMGERGWR